MVFPKSWGANELIKAKKKMASKNHPEDLGCGLKIVPVKFKSNSKLSNIRKGPISGIFLKICLDKKSISGVKPIFDF